MLEKGAPPSRLWEFARQKPPSVGGRRRHLLRLAQLKRMKTGSRRIKSRTTAGTSVYRGGIRRKARGFLFHEPEKVPKAEGRPVIDAVIGGLSGADEPPPAPGRFEPQAVARVSLQARFRREALFQIGFSQSVFHAGRPSYFRIISSFRIPGRPGLSREGGGSVMILPRAARKTRAGKLVRFFPRCPLTKRSREAIIH